MKRGVLILVGVLGSSGLGTRLWALPGESSAGPYHGIVERNVFNLKPPPPAVPPEPPAAPPPKITLTGITTILGGKKALMRVAVPARPPEPAKEESYILTEDERRGDVQVLQIDEKEGTVKVNNHGTVQTLDFKNDGAKQVAVALPPPTPGAVPPPVVMPPAPGPATPPPVPGPGGRTIPTRTMRLPTAPGTSGQPMLGLPGAAAAQPGVTPQMSGGYSEDEQTIMIEAHRLKFQQDGNPAAAILPPTRLTPMIDGSGGGTPKPTARP